MRRQGSSAAVLLAAISAFLLLAGCGTGLRRGPDRGFDHLGFLTWSAPGIIPVRPAPAVDPRTAALGRDAITNALSLTFSPVQRLRASSLLLRDYSVLLRFTSSEPLACTAPVLDLPLDASKEIDVTGVRADGTIAVLLRTSRLGRDLLLSALMSPGGVTGLVSCGERTMWLRGRALDPAFVYASVWVRRVESGVRLYLHSESEYPIAVHQLSMDGSATPISFSGDARLDPWDTLSFKLPDGWSRPEFHRLAVQAAPITTTPVTFKQYRTEAQ